MGQAATSPEEFRILLTEKLKNHNNPSITPLKDISTLSAVLMPLKRDKQGRIGLLLTKRSNTVAQPGDYCFPGGHINLISDTLAATVLSRLPLRFLQPWQFPGNNKNLRTLAAAALRESWEEVGINPLYLRMLGALPPRNLVSFNKTIYPFAAWTERAEKLRPNHEVDSVLFVTVADFLNSRFYTALDVNLSKGTKKTICFHPPGDSHFIWGATLSIILDFLNIVFGFIPPDREELPQKEYSLPAGYFPEE